MYDYRTIDDAVDEFEKVYAGGFPVMWAAIADYVDGPTQVNKN